MWERAFARYLDRFITTGTLTLRIGDGPVRTFGGGDPPHVGVTLANAGVGRRLLLHPDLALGEAYMDGDLVIDHDDVQGLLAFALANLNATRTAGLSQTLIGRVRHLLRGIEQNNHRRNARRNVAHHYDLLAELYDLFLDADRQYSCAYFHDPNLSLDMAQEAKKAHVVRKLMISPGMEVLDIGCGWGGLGLTLARDYGAHVTGITLSEEQHRVATARASAAGLSDRVRFELRDYRDLTGTYDRIVSVGMFEHVGAPHFTTYFNTVRDRLSPDGVALIHTIGRTAPPEPTSAWIAKYIFPGGYVPALSEVADAIQTAGLRIGDIECLRLHYAMTLRHWFDRSSANAGAAARINDERFVRMWRFYLAASEQTFRHGPQDVFQFQLARRADAVPITRDYLYRPALLAERQAAE
jgi:cyclopropane-fatty-acyl-phospholipid synthase